MMVEIQEAAAEWQNLIFPPIFASLVPQNLFLNTLSSINLGKFIKS